MNWPPMRYLVRADFRDSGRQCGVLGKENRYDEQTEGKGSIGWGVRCGDDDDVSLVRMGFGEVENTAGDGPWAASCRPNIINPSISDEDIAMLRQDLRAKKMQVIGQNLSLSDGEAKSSGRSTTITSRTCR